MYSSRVSKDPTDTNVNLRSCPTDQGNVWAVILAGGDGLPRTSRVPSYRRGQRPRQFSRTANTDFIINQTRDWISGAISPERTLYTVSYEHLRYAHDVLDDVPDENIIVEPKDDGTVFAMLYSLLRLREKDPFATVVFLPADVSTPDGDGFLAGVRDAIEAVRQVPTLTLLGVEPATPDTDREWIEPDLSVPIHNSLNLWRVLGFKDRVSRQEANELFDRGGLWNSNVVVGTIPTFLRKIRRAKSHIYDAFVAAAPRIGTPAEFVAIQRVYYENSTESDFSREILPYSAEKIAVVPVTSRGVKGAGKSIAQPPSALDSGLLHAKPIAVAAAA